MTDSQQLARALRERLFADENIELWLLLIPIGLLVVIVLHLTGVAFR